MAENAAALQKAVDLVEAELDAGTFPGAALVVTSRRQSILERYWGTYCDSDGNDKQYDGSVVNMLYSFSKGVSATVVVMAKQKGLIDYDAPLNRYISGFKGGGKDGITIRHLLTHSAGIPTPPFRSVHTRQQWEDAVQAVCAMEVEWEPGSKCSYHAATGALMAAEAVLRVTGEDSWGDLCRRWLLDPLSCGTLGFEVPTPDVPLALTSRPAEFPCPVDDDHFWMLGAPGGGCFGTVGDVLRILHLHLNGGVWEGERLVEPDALAEMHTIQNHRQIELARAAGQTSGFEYWGLGWQLRGESTSGWFGFGRLASKRSFGHAGIDTVMTVADPERDLAIAFLTTDSPKPSDENTVRIRNAVTDLVIAAVPPQGATR
jgi:CubicO group peptidase (beta-lactamase class C family)